MKFPLDISGQITAFFEPVPLACKDRVGPRPGIVYRMDASHEFVRLNFGGRSITFPGFLRECLDFALNTSAYVIEDIGGGLEDKEKLAFIERLVQEGLVVLK